MGALRLLGSLLLAAACCHAPRDAVAGDEPILDETLPGGAALIVQRMPAAPTFGIALVVRGGRAEDPQTQYGLTEVLSRMLLRGSSTRTADAQALEVESAGASLSVTGGVLGVMLRASGPLQAFDRTLDVLLDATAHPRLDPADLAGEIELARQRLRASFDIPSTWRERAALPLLFAGHSLGRVADPDHYLESIDIAAVRAAHTARCTAGRMSLAVAGDLEPGHVRRTFQRWLASLPIDPGPAAGPAAALPHPRPLASPAHARAKRRTTQPELLVALPTPGIDQADEPAMDLLIHILTGPEERLALEIRQARGWAYWLVSMDWRYPGAGAFGVLTAVPRKRLGDATGIIVRELERIAAEPPGAEEVDRARRYLLAELARAWQRPSGRAEALAAAAIRGRPLLSYDARAERYANVTSGEIRDLAAKLMAWSRPAIVTLY